jgi:hypothetical protein
VALGTRLGPCARGCMNHTRGIGLGVARLNAFEETEAHTTYCMLLCVHLPRHTDFLARFPLKIKKIPNAQHDGARLG